MRRILVDHARKRLADKRGAGAERVTLSGIDLPAATEGAAFTAVDAESGCGSSGEGT